MSLKAMAQMCDAIEKARFGGNMISESFSSWALDILDKTPDVEIASGCFDVLGALVRGFGVASIQPRLSDVLKKSLDGIQGHLNCQSENDQYIEELHMSLEVLIKGIIDSLKEDAPEVLKDYLPFLMSLSRSKSSKQMKNFGLSILGELVEFSGSKLGHEFLRCILDCAIVGLSKESRVAVFVLNQFTSGAPDFLKSEMNRILQICHLKLALPARKAASRQEFLENVVATVAEIRRNVLGDDFPINEFLVPCLRKMPAKCDPSLNLEMFQFFLWLAGKSGMNPIDEFTAAAVRLFALTSEEMGGLAETDENVLERVKECLILGLGKIGDAMEFVNRICEGDGFKIERIRVVLDGN
jgi:hypothetical protein